MATLGPATGSREKIGALIRAGTNVVRINCSHGNWDDRHRWIEWVRELSPEISPVGILVDLQGPKFRLGTVEGGEIVLQAGQSITIGQNEGVTLPIPQHEIFERIEPGDRILIGDGEVEIKVGGRCGCTFDAKALCGGPVKSRKGLTLVGKAFSVPAITDQDRHDVFEACKAGADFIALSYVREPVDIRDLRRLVDQYDPTVRLCAKIETREALREIDDILKVSDVVMVARGDLGLQMDTEDVPLAQKRIIGKAVAAGVPVITATQMLESMIVAPRPTRAEASDVANAILDGTDAIMLSGETATGQYPVEAVKTMARIAEKAETLLDHHDLDATPQTNLNTTQAVARSAAQLAASIRAKAIVTTTTSGTTPRMVSKFRPRVPVLCAAWNPRTQAQMALVWGVESLTIAAPRSTDDAVAAAIDAFLRHKKLRVGDTVVVTAGIPPGTAGHTNLILVETVK
ncbi:MAG: Pyruvate kinase [Fimbriimonadaceae bacterium]|nr:Pyruvate kinase [Fimbriimonadaceae bacterium]